MKRTTCISLSLLAVCLLGIALVFVGLLTMRRESNATSSLESIVIYDETFEEIENESDVQQTSTAPLTSESIDWDALYTINPSAGYWLQVPEAGISTCVAVASESDPQFWLTHDAWGNTNSIGCPYLDWRCTSSNVARYIYGHHLTNQVQGFSPLASVSSISDLENLGHALLISEDQVTSYRPVLCLEVEETYLYLRYVPDTSGLQEWLLHLYVDAKYRSASSKSDIESCDEVLVLITCSNILPGPKTRTAVVFVK